MIKKNSFSLITSLFIFCMPLFSINAQPKHLIRVLSDESLKAQFAPFLDTVLRQVPSDTFFTFSDRIRDSQEWTTDEELYAQLYNKVSSIKSWCPLFKKFKALQYQKRVLGKQIVQLLGYDDIQGCVEIGTPGTYLSAIQSHIKLSGPFYTIGDQKNVTDIMQAGRLAAATPLISQSSFVPLDNYDPIDEKNIPSNSIDLVICVIGLHHIPVEKIDAFVASIRRILKPGGKFILRDHDAYSADLLSLVHAAHSVFNVVLANESVETEMAEYRNFQPLQHWIDLLEKHEFQTEPLQLRQKGDPTLNTLLLNIKIAQTFQEKEAAVVQKIKKECNHDRNIINTYLTAPEWYNVDISQEYAQFIEHTPFYQFPYFKSIASFWSIFKNSWRLAARKKGHTKVLFSDPVLMNLFVGITMTLEYAAKGIISYPISLMYKDSEPTTLKALIRDPYEELETLDYRIRVTQVHPGTHLKTVEIPRYKVFFDIIQKMAHAYSSVTFESIAGNDIIQVKTRYKKDQTEIDFSAIFGCTKEYEWTVPTQPNYRYANFTVNTNCLLTALQKLAAQGIEILYIHDF